MKKLLLMAFDNAGRQYELYHEDTPEGKAVVLYLNNQYDDVWDYTDGDATEVAASFAEWYSHLGRGFRFYDADHARKYFASFLTYKEG